jgi:hypothetical protein
MMVGRNFMTKLTRVSLFLMLFSLVSSSFLILSASAQNGEGFRDPSFVDGDSNSGLCGKPVCPGLGNDGRPINDHGGPNDHGDPCMNMPPGPAQADCYRHKDDHRGPGDMNRGPNDHRGPPGGENCAAIPHPNGSQHVDPPQSKIDAVEAEYKAGCKAGNCGISPNTYASLESLGHSRQEVDCFLREGERRHNDQHDGRNDHGGPNDHMNRGPNDHGGPNDHQADQRDRDRRDQDRDRTNSEERAR